ncbi:molybdenum cofactor biosynthesis protein MoaE [Rhodococcus rhodnii]|uniref:Molybdopterin converting factor n=2 Tax=Rhodococcus rhodnii TaxID=38312 RepID=R7WLT8_9NOCA|nr:molybdenum cofactor biosynthesis protein MoaE [Rhodococcus rhodnii]EOM76250.1 molybdopterin converting factor [Rhodococcus rhodnii LMG 5362]TXG90730.1 molybdenum cofactor biosynthesis protein MoaE [Rhodococcus rhodnii]
MTDAAPDTRLARISSEPLDPAWVDSAVAGAHFGAVVTFTGVVRDHDDGRDVRALEYSSHPDAERFLAACCDDVSAASGLPVAAVHRVGDLAIGDLAIVVAVAAAHRREAFVACSELVERIKHDVPIWKRQHFATGVSEWVGL